MPAQTDMLWVDRMSAPFANIVNWLGVCDVLEHDMCRPKTT